MAFQIQNFARASASANEEIIDIESVYTAINSSGVLTEYRYNTDCRGCFRTYNYYSKYYPTPVIGGLQTAATGDTQAVIAGSGYFNPVAYMLQTGDLITAYSTADDNYKTYRVLVTKATEVNTGRLIVSVTTILLNPNT